MHGHTIGASNVKRPVLSRCETPQKAANSRPGRSRRGPPSAQATPRPCRRRRVEPLRAPASKPNRARPTIASRDGRALGRPSQPTRHYPLSEPQGEVRNNNHHVPQDRTDVLRHGSPHPTALSALGPDLASYAASTHMACSLLASTCQRSPGKPRRSVRRPAPVWPGPTPRAASPWEALVGDFTQPSSDDHPPPHKQRFPDNGNHPPDDEPPHTLASTASTLRMARSAS
jgi:hypothetical protein